MVNARENTKPVELQQPEMISIGSLTLLLPDGSNHNIISPFKRDGLKNDIAQYGFDEPLQVWEHGDKLFVVNGHKRFQAMKDLKAEKILIVRKDFRDRKEALAYSIRRNQERGQNDDQILAQIIKEISPEYDDIEALAKSVVLSERELFDLTFIDKDLELPKRNSGEREISPKETVRVQMVLTVETKRQLDLCIERAAREAGVSGVISELSKSVALSHILERYKSTGPLPLTPALKPKKKSKKGLDI